MSASLGPQVGDLPGPPASLCYDTIAQTLIPTWLWETSKRVQSLQEMTQGLQEVTPHVGF